MKIVIEKQNGELPIASDRRGYQLESFIPEGYDWQQMGYGKGEGQIVVLNCEWGVYYASATKIVLELHSGSISIQQALNFIAAFIDHVRGDDFVAITVEGCNQWDEQ